MQSLQLVQEMRSVGRGFNGVTWRNSPTILALKQYKPLQRIVTTEPMGVYYLTGIPSINVPQKVDPVRAGPRAKKSQLLSALHDWLSQPDTILVIFFRSLNRPEMLSLQELTDGLLVVARYKDGAIYRLP